MKSKSKSKTHVEFQCKHEDFAFQMRLSAVKSCSMIPKIQQYRVECFVGLSSMLKKFGMYRFLVLGIVWSLRLDVSIGVALSWFCHRRW